MVGFFKRLIRKKRGKNTITHLSITEREEIIQLYSIEQWKPQDIAAETGQTVETVSKLIESERRKMSKRNQSLTLESTDDLKELKKEMLMLELQDKKKEMEFKHEMRQIKREEQRADLYDYDEEEAEQDPLNAVLASFLAGITGAQQQQTNSLNTPVDQAGQKQAIKPTQKIKLSDNEINVLLDQHQKQIKPIQKLEDNTLKSMITAQFPQLSNETIKRGIELIKQKDFTKQVKL